MFGSSLDDLLPKINKRVAVVLFTIQYLLAVYCFICYLPCSQDVQDARLSMYSSTFA